MSGGGIPVVGSAIDAISDVGGAILETGGAIVDIIDDTVVTPTLSAGELLVVELEEACEFVWQGVLSPIVEEVANLFGFTDEEKIESFVVHNKLFDNSSYNDYLTYSILNKIRNNVDMKSTVLNAHFEGYNRFEDFVLEAFYNYTDGLPTSNLKSNFNTIEDFKNLVDSTLGLNVNVLNNIYKIPTDWEWIHHKYRLAHMSYRPTTKTYLNTDGYYYTIIGYTYDSINNRYVIQIQNKTTQSISIEYLNRISLSDGNVFLVGYYLYNGYYYYFIAQRDLDTGLLNVARDKEFDMNDMAYLDMKLGRVSNLVVSPYAMIRINSVNVTSSTMPTRYEKTVKLLNTLGLDLDTLVNNLNENPNISTTTDAYIHLALNVRDNSKAVSLALFDTFYYAMGSSQTPTPVFDGNTQEYQYSYYLVTFNGDSSTGRVKTALTWQYSPIEEFTGSIGEVGTALHTINGTDLILEKQIYSNKYVKITIKNLNSLTYLNIEGKAGIHMTDVTSDLLIPLSLPLTYIYDPYTQLELYYNCVHYTIQGGVKVHLDWYQTEAFGTFMEYLGYFVATVSGGLPALAIAVVSTYVIKRVIAMNIPTGLKALIIAGVVVLNIEAINTLNAHETAVSNATSCSYEVPTITDTVNTMSFSLSASQLSTIAYKTITNTVNGVYSSKTQRAIEETNEINEEGNKILEEYIDIYKKLVGTDTSFMLDIINNYNKNYTSVNDQVVTPDLLYNLPYIDKNYSLLYSYDALIYNYYDNALNVI